MDFVRLQRQPKIIYTPVATKRARRTHILLQIYLTLQSYKTKFVFVALQFLINLRAFIGGVYDLKFTSEKLLDLVEVTENYWYKVVLSSSTIGVAFE